VSSPTRFRIRDTRHEWAKDQESHRKKFVWNNLFFAIFFLKLALARKLELDRLAQSSCICVESCLLQLQNKFAIFKVRDYLELLSGFVLKRQQCFHILTSNKTQWAHVPCQHLV
jgi:hypothetical protein